MLFVIEDMEYIQAQNRLQMHFSCLEEQIGDSNSVRVLEAFVNKLDLEQLQFTVASLKTEGRPPFHPTLFLKLYLYGYLNVLEKVNGEHSLICLVYNLKRSINILGIPELLEKLQNWQPNYKRIARLCQKLLRLQLFYALQNFGGRVAA